MAFTSFKNLTEVVKKYELFYDVQTIISLENVTAMPSANLVETIDFNLRETVYDASEASLCEAIIYPILQDVWKNFRDKLLLWSHTGIEADDILTGIPDYIVAKKSAYGRVLGTPLLTTVEAKKDNFADGWTQCATQLLAMQKINQSDSNYTLFGIVTNGESWEFAQLSGNKLLKNTITYSVFDLEQLYKVLFFIFSDCYKQVNLK